MCDCPPTCRYRLPKDGCALVEADKGPRSPFQVAKLMGLSSKDEVLRIEAAALEAFAEAAKRMLLAELEESLL